MDLRVYLAQDRLRALARNEALPDRTSGCVLFADILGFTPLTEKLRRVLGARLGAETVAQHLSRVYGALIEPVEEYGGSVVTFAGDAISCWFDDAHISDSLAQSPISGRFPLRDQLTKEVKTPPDDARGDAAARAAACALRMQAAIQPFQALALPNGHRAELALKISLATGPVRRFVVGDPDLQRLDTLAGGTMRRAARGERLAAEGEVLIDGPT
ncbi:MAG: adenylate/guanylate cyclase domain-containing protein, partial [Anaerolineae bacterium]